MIQWKLLIAAVLSIALFASGWHLGGLKAEKAAAQQDRDAMKDKLDAVLDAQKQDKARAEKLQKTLDRLPKAEGAIREVVRDNPANCDRPAAVSERLRQAVREANAARAVPGDS